MKKIQTEEVIELSDYPKLTNSTIMVKLNTIVSKNCGNVLYVTTKKNQFNRIQVMRHADAKHGKK